MILWLSFSFTTVTNWRTFSLTQRGPQTRHRAPNRALWGLGGTNHLLQALANAALSAAASVTARVCSWVMVSMLSTGTPHPPLLFRRGQAGLGSIQQYQLVKAGQDVNTRNGSYIRLEGSTESTATCEYQQIQWGIPRLLCSHEAQSSPGAKLPDSKQKEQRHLPNVTEGVPHSDLATFQISRT